MRVTFNANNQLFTMLLVGLAGNKPHIQSSTIRSLIFAIKKNVILRKSDDEMLEADPEDLNKIHSSDAGFQQFLAKSTRIVLLFLKNKGSPQELHRSVL